MVGVIGFVCVYALGWIAGRAWRPRLESPPPKGRWTGLPSGWSCAVGEATAYAMLHEGRAYWWVARRGRTVIEGPAPSLAVAREEAEREARALEC